MFAATRKCADQARKNLEREERQLRVIYFHWRDYRDPRDIPTRALSAHCIANRRHARSTDPAIHDPRFQLLLFARKFIQNPFEGFLSLETLPAVIGSGLEWSGVESNRNRAAERSPAHRAKRSRTPFAPFARISSELPHGRLLDFATARSAARSTVAGDLSEVRFSNDHVVSRFYRVGIAGTTD